MGRNRKVHLFSYRWHSENRNCAHTNNIHTYIIGHCSPAVRIIDLVSHTAYVVCVNFIHKWRDLQFKVESERQIFLRNFSWQFLFTLRVFGRNLLRGNRRRNAFCTFCFDVWPGARTLALHLISQHTTYGDFIMTTWYTKICDFIKLLTQYYMSFIVLSMTQRNELQ